MKSYEILTARVKTVEALVKLRKDVDPASGISIMVRRGPLSDQAEDDDDRERREWIQLETALEMDDILTHLISTQEDSIDLWIRATQDDIKAAQAALKLVGLEP